jgi:hypothetical protein
LIGAGGSLLGSIFQGLGEDDPQMVHTRPEVMRDVMSQYDQSPYGYGFVPGPAGPPPEISGAFAQREALRRQQMEAMQNAWLTATGQQSMAEEQGRAAVGQLQNQMVAQAAYGRGSYNPAMLAQAQQQGSMATGRAAAPIAAAKEQERLAALQAYQGSMAGQRGLDAGAWKQMMARDAWERQRQLDQEKSRGQAAMLGFGAQTARGAGLAGRETAATRIKGATGGDWP